MTLENISPISFTWHDLVGEKLEGETGHANMKTQMLGAIRLRQVEYSANYFADHWCNKGHIVFVISGELTIEHIDKTELTLKSGVTYVVGDNSMLHKAKSTAGATALIVD